MANVTEAAFDDPAWRPDHPFEAETEDALAPPKYCITEMSAAGLVVIALAVSAGLWLAIAAVI